jgi:hypothetical protein
MIFDVHMHKAVTRSVNLYVPWYLMAAYAYYVDDDPILSDAVFDGMARKMLENWEKIKHQHKHYITVDDLRAGSLLLADYPLRVIGAVETIRREGCVR